MSEINESTMVPLDDAPEEVMHHLYDRYWIRIRAESDSSMLAHQSGNVLMFDFEEQLKSFGPYSCRSILGDIFRFDEMLTKVRRRNRVNEQSQIIFSVASSINSQINVAFLLGCHLMLSSGMSYEQILSVFEPYLEKLAINSSRLHTFWSAVNRARVLGWLRGQDCDAPDDDVTIEMEEYFHYAR
jgi:predicted Rdx family selenoprotein